MNAELDRLPEMLARLGLKATRDRLDNLLDEAGRRDLSLREALSLVCAAEVDQPAHRHGSPRPDPVDLGTHQSLRPVRPRHDVSLGHRVSEMATHDTNVGSRPRRCAAHRR